MPTNKSVTVNPVPEAVEKVVCPVTLSVPCDVRDEVAVMLPPVVVPTVRVVMFAFVAVRFVKKAVTALRSVEKKLVDVLLIEERLSVKRFEVVAEVITAEDAVRVEIFA